MRNKIILPRKCEKVWMGDSMYIAFTEEVWESDLHSKPSPENLQTRVEICIHKIGDYDLDYPVDFNIIKAPLNDAKTQIMDTVSLSEEFLVIGENSVTNINEFSENIKKIERGYRKMCSRIPIHMKRELDTSFHTSTTVKVIHSNEEYTSTEIVISHQVETNTIRLITVSSRTLDEYVFDKMYHHLKTNHVIPGISDVCLL